MSNALSLQGSQFDIVALIEADHRAVEALFARFFDAGADARGALAEVLVQTLSVHEFAEEAVLYPALNAVSDAPNPVVEERLAEQARASQGLADLGRLHPATGAFADALEALRRDVLAHAAAEEKEVLPLVVANDDALDRISLGSRYLTAKSRAPTRPHPHAPRRPPGGIVVGRLLSVVDRLRDRLG